MKCCTASRFQRPGLLEQAELAQGHRLVVESQRQVHLHVEVLRLLRDQLAAQVDRFGVIGPGRNVVSRKLLAVRDLAVAGRKLVAGEYVARLIGDPSLGEGFHLAKPDLRRPEVAVETVGAPQPEIGIE